MDIMCFFISWFCPQSLGGALPASAPRDDMVGVFQGIQQCSSRRAGVHFASSWRRSSNTGLTEGTAAFPFTFPRGVRRRTSQLPALKFPALVPLLPFCATLSADRTRRSGEEAKVMVWTPLGTKPGAMWTVHAQWSQPAATSSAWWGDAFSPSSHSGNKPFDPLGALDLLFVHFTWLKIKTCRSSRLWNHRVSHVTVSLSVFLCRFGILALLFAPKVSSTCRWRAT